MDIHVQLINIINVSVTLCKQSFVALILLFFLLAVCSLFNDIQNF